MQAEVLVKFAWFAIVKDGHQRNKYRWISQIRGDYQELLETALPILGNIRLKTWKSV